MNSIRIKTDGAILKGHRYGAGTYEAPVEICYEGPGYYWLEPAADYSGLKWSDIDIYLGECKSEADLMNAIGEVSTNCIETADPHWLTGAKTQRSPLVETQGWLAS